MNIQPVGSTPTTEYYGRVSRRGRAKYIFVSVQGASAKIAISLCECNVPRSDTYVRVQANIFILARAF